VSEYVFVVGLGPGHFLVTDQVIFPVTLHEGWIDKLPVIGTKLSYVLDAILQLLIELSIDPVGEIEIVQASQLPLKRFVGSVNTHEPVIIDWLHG
jgi:hypothetical protein